MNNELHCIVDYDIKILVFYDWDSTIIILPSGDWEFITLVLVSLNDIHLVIAAKPPDKSLAVVLTIFELFIMTSA